MARIKWDEVIVDGQTLEEFLSEKEVEEVEDFSLDFCLASSIEGEMEVACDCCGCTFEFPGSLRAMDIAVSKCECYCLHCS